MNNKRLSTLMENNLLSVIKEKNLIPLSILKLYIWQDECEDQFLLTRAMEIFLWNKSTLGLYIFTRHSKNILNKCHKEGLIFDIIELDEEFTECKTNIENLPFLLSLSREFKKRPSKRGKWILKMEKILEHKILPFRIYIKKDIKCKMPEKALEKLKEWRESQKSKILNNNYS